MEEQKNEQRKPPSAYTNVPPKKPEEKPADKVAQGRPRRKSLGERFSETFIASDMKSVREHLFWDVIVPAFKRVVDDLVEGGKNMILYGDKYGRYTERRDGRSVVRREYDRIYDDRNGRRDRDRDDRDSPRPKPRDMVEDVVFETRAGAEKVLDNLIADIRQFNFVTVRRFYEYADMGSDYTKDKYGWYNLDNAMITREPDGFLLHLPRPQVID